MNLIKETTCGFRLGLLRREFKMQQKIYLGCPYTHDDPDVREKRFLQVSKFAATLLQKSYLVFSPISHSHQICVEADLPIEFEYWKELDNSFIEWCDIMVVLKLDGWEDSNGLKEEIALAEFMGKEIKYVDYID